jgi:Rrf2 family iron-sulfur cluster assembly transcriptional regulator
MKLSTRTRYGTRLMVDLAQHYDQGRVQIGNIARRQDISIKYLEQIIIPLKKANLIKSVRGPKGGHMLTKSPDNIRIGEVVEILENGKNISHCVKDPQKCDRYSECKVRDIWEMASDAMYEKLNSLRLSELI